jgi:hypothetical protein
VTAAGYEVAVLLGSSCTETALAVTSEEGTPVVEVTRYYVIRQASHWHGIIRGLPNMIVVQVVMNQVGKVTTLAVHATCYHADLTAMPSRQPCTRTWKQWDDDPGSGYTTACTGLTDQQNRRSFAHGMWRMRMAKWNSRPS